MMEEIARGCAASIASHCDGKSGSLPSAASGATAGPQRFRNEAIRASFCRSRWGGGSGIQLLSANASVPAARIWAHQRAMSSGVMSNTPHEPRPPARATAIDSGGARMPAIGASRIGISRRMRVQGPRRIARTELVWPGKYDEQGALLEPPRLDLPFQVLESFASGEPAWSNRLIWGENLCVLASLVGELAGRVDLIYIDPPFLAGRDFTQSSGEGMRAKAYYDTWGGGRDAYLTMMWPRLRLARELLSERGSLYFHIGPNVNHYVRALLDEIFGGEGG